MFKRPLIASVVLLLAAGCARFERKTLNPAASASALQQRSLDAPALLEFLHTNLPPSAPWPPVAWDLEALTWVGLFYHPSLAVAREQWEVAKGGIVTAEQRPNPTLNVTPGYNFSSVKSGPGAVASPWFPAINLDLPIETAGKRGYRRDRAAHAAESARLAWVETAWRIRNGIRVSLVELTYTAARLKELQEQAEIETRLVQIAEQRLEAGAVSTLELGQRRVAADKAILEVVDGRRLSALARTKLAEALGVPNGALASVVFSFEFIPRADAAVELMKPALQEAALRGRADVLGALADFEASQSALQLEIARQYPDLHIGNGYQYDQGDHKWTLSLTLELPVLNQNQGPIAEARARREEAAARLLSVQAQVLGMLERATTDWKLAMATFEQAARLNTTHREALKLAEAQFAIGSSDLLDVMTARVEASTGQLSVLAAAFQVQQALEQLENAVQRPTDSLANVGSLESAVLSPP